VVAVPLKDHRVAVLVVLAVEPLGQIPPQVKTPQQTLAAVLAEGLITREESARIFRVSAAVVSQRTLAAALAAAVPHLRVATVVHRLAEQVELEVFLT
jgi:hypothetical protein